MKQFFSLAALLLLVSSCQKQDSLNKHEKAKKMAALPASISPFTKNFAGTIHDKLKVLFHLENNNGQLSGFYYYTHVGLDIKVIGQMKDQYMELYELDETNNKTAKITGLLEGTHFYGEWENLRSHKKLPLTMKELKRKVMPLPQNIKGVYSVSSTEESCPMQASISKGKGGYRYVLHAGSNEYQGQVTFQRPVEANEIYVQFEGIKWAEYLGDISDLAEDNLPKEEDEAPTGIDGLWEEDRITIQNCGNAMNSYVKFGDCDKKFIELVKKF